jgi:hypothetical protein
MGYTPEFHEMMFENTNLTTTFNLGPAALCAKCKVHLELVEANEPWTTEYLICPKCDSTHAIGENNND